jgi:hypothetical protein
MKIIYILTSLLGINSHISMINPPSRRNQASSYYVSQGLVNYNLRSPLNVPPDFFSFPCKGFPQGPSVSTFNGNNIQVTLEGTAVHGGGHCQFGISYDNSHFLVLKTVLNSCLLDSMTYNFDLPDDAPGGKMTVFWTWVNRIGNREYYMECTDVTVNNGNSPNKFAELKGTELLVVNLPGYPTVPEWNPGDSAEKDGRTLFYNRREIVVTVNNNREQVKRPERDERVKRPEGNERVKRPEGDERVKRPERDEQVECPEGDEREKHSERFEQVEMLTELNKCNLGDMKCHNNGFDTCVYDNWVYKDCAPGTKCKQNGNSIICDYIVKSIESRTFLLKSKPKSKQQSIIVRKPKPKQQSIIVRKPKPLLTPIPTKNFVIWNGYDFTLQGKKFYVVGVNVYWLGLDESYNYPSKGVIEDMFIKAKKMSSTVIRSHTLGHSSGSEKSLLENLNNKNAWASIDYSFYLAKKYNIKLICPLTDNYFWYNGNYGDYCKKRGIKKSDFWTNKIVRNDFKAYISAWLNHVNQYTGVAIKDDPNLFLIEIGNELGNIRDDTKWGGKTTIPTKEWLEDISKYIKSIDKNHMVLAGTDECLGSSTSDEFSIRTIDAFGAHFYGEDYTRLNNGLKKAVDLKKPYIIGEYSPHFSQEWFNYIQDNRNISGAIWWNLYPDNVEHDDGYTLRYGDPKNRDELIKITNYHRKVQGLPQINYLP